MKICTSMLRTREYALLFLHYSFCQEYIYHNPNIVVLPNPYAPLFFLPFSVQWFLHTPIAFKREYEEYSIMPASVSRGFAFSNLMDLTIRLNTRLILFERSAIGAFNQHCVDVCRNERFTEFWFFNKIKNFPTCNTRIKGERKHVLES